MHGIGDGLPHADRRNTFRQDRRIAIPPRLALRVRILLGVFASSFPDSLTHTKDLVNLLFDNAVPFEFQC